MRHLLPLRYIDAVVRAGSIRKAAEALSITSTALNRRILSMEQELGVAIFERLPRGVRLSTAGEILIQHVRSQLSDMERVRSQIADLSGVRRGHISIACSQAVLPVFLPEQIALYRREHPAVTFRVYRRDREAAEQALVDHTADLALVFEPVRLSDFETLLAVQQPIHALMCKGHPLAKKAGRCGFANACAIRSPCRRICTVCAMCSTGPCCAPRSSCSPPSNPTASSSFATTRARTTPSAFRSRSASRRNEPRTMT